MGLIGRETSNFVCMALVHSTVYTHSALIVIKHAPSSQDLGAIPFDFELPSEFGASYKSHFRSILECSYPFKSSDVLSHFCHFHVSAEELWCRCITDSGAENMNTVTFVFLILLQTFCNTN